MDLICRICLQSEVEELIPISCREATHLKRICDLISAVTSLSVDEFDRLPQHVCSECFWQLARAYRLWELCRDAVRREGLHQKQQNDHTCRICCVLIEGKACRKWDMDIGDMVQHLTGAFIEINDISHSWFVCKNCLLEMDAAYEFKSKCIESEASLLKTTSFVWERMEVDPCNPEHLVMDLYAEALQEQDVLGRVHCSVCMLAVEMRQFDKKCEGCKLQFRNYDEIRSVQAPLCAEENSEISPVGIDSVWIEENLSQEFIDDEREEKYLIEDDIMLETNTEVETVSQIIVDDDQSEDSLIVVDDMFDTNTEADDDNHAALTEPSYKVYNDDSKIEYEIFEMYPDDPFPKARPTGPFCCKCMKFFDSSYVLEKHMHSRHKNPTGSGEFACYKCLSLFTDLQSLQLHKVKLQTFFYDYCKSCQILLSTPYLLLQHKLKCHPEIETVLEAVANKQATSKSVCASVRKNSTTATEESCPTAHSKKSIRTNQPLVLKHFSVVNSKSVSADKNSTTATEESCPTAHDNKSTRTNQPLVLKHSSVVINKSVFVGKNSTTATEGSYSKEVETKFKTKIFVTYDCCLQNCNKRYPSEEQLLNHLNTAHDQPTQLLGNVCQYCKENFPNETALLEHTNRKVERKTYSCLIDGCDFRDTAKSCMIQHCRQNPHVTFTKNNESNKKPRSLIKRGPLDLNHFSVVSKLDDNTDIVERKGELCCNCFLLFDSKEELTTHCEQHKTKGMQPFQCSVCDRGFLRKSAYTQHKHLTEKRFHYFCRLCEKMLWTKYYYTCHRAIHLPEDKNSTTAIEESSTMDVETNFQPEIYVTYDCCVRKCYNRYSSEELLSKHFKAAHDQLKPLLGYACQYCKENFPDETALLEHHANRKVERTLYRCLIDDCGFTRSNKSCMIQHCSQKPHVKAINGDNDTPLAVIKRRPLDLKHFSVVKKVDDNTVVLKRKGELCCTCFLLFDSKEELTAHCEQHSPNLEEKPFHCLVCGRGFPTHAAYSNHMKLTENPLHYFCQVCEKMLWTKHDYITHRAKLHFPEDENVPFETMVDDSFVCCGCKEQFETEAELVEHRREKHPPPLASPSKRLRKPKCDYCHSYFDVVWKLEKHIALYENKNIYKCKLPSCGFSSKDSQQIRRHILGARHQHTLSTTIFHADPSEYLCCVIDCEFKCHDYDTMIKHGTEMHAQTREHFSIAHENRKFKCQVCRKGFKREIALVNHKSQGQACNCKGCKRKSIKCEICDKVSTSINNLRRHVKLMHLNERKQLGVREKQKRDKEVCNICGKTYNNISTHMDNHKNERKWKCKICGARFNSVFLLRSHQRVHTNEKNYACRHGCEKRYKGSGDRDRHEKLVHLGITPFRCEICEASFVRMRDLQLHQRKHTGLKLYSCSRCYADFDKKSEYDDHCKQCKTSLL